MKDKAQLLAEKYGWTESVSPIIGLLEKIKLKSRVIVAFSGKMGAGKDSAGLAFAEEELNSRGYLLQHFSFATPLRDEVTEIISNYSPETDKEQAKDLGVGVLQLRKLVKLLNGKSVFKRSVESRQALQYWGTDVRRKKDPDYWVKKAFQHILKELSGSNVVKGFYITDPRFQNEVELIEDLGGLVIRLDVAEDLRIERIKLRDGTEPTKEALTHVSEYALDKYPFKYVISENFATARTPEQVAKSAHKIFLEKDEEVTSPAKREISPEKRKELLSILDRISKHDKTEELERNFKNLFGRKLLFKIIKNSCWLYIVADWETGQHYVCDVELLADIILNRDITLLDNQKCGKNSTEQWKSEREFWKEQ